MTTESAQLLTGSATSAGTVAGALYAERGDVCIGFIECRCARCLIDPQQQAGKRRLAEIRAANRV